jgi:type VII secretion protein EccB
MIGTRNEQVRAHRFVTRRIVSAMLAGEPESTEQPGRRLALTLVASVIVATIVLAVVGIYGFINPTGGVPNEDDIIIMRETGARFVYVDGQLHPVLNYASALLVVGTPNPQVRTMSRRSLQKVPRGQPVGIPGAPDPPPDRAALDGLPWSVCGAVPAGTTGRVPTQLFTGRVPAGGAPLGARAVLVSTNRTGNSLPMYLLWNDHRLRITDRTVLTALDLAAVTPVPIGAPLLNSIPSGPDLAPIAVPDAGTKVQVAGQSGEVGRVYRSSQRDYVLTRTGLVPIGAVTATLLLAGGARAQEIAPADAARALSNDRIEPAGFPQTRPALYTGRQPTICATFRAGRAAGDDSVGIEIFDVGSEQIRLPPGPTVVQDGQRTADLVVVPQGRGALVRSIPAPGVQVGTTVHLVTDQGLKFPLRDADDVKSMDALGYSGVRPLGVPAAMLALIPTGPTLDPAAARTFVSQPTRPAPPTQSPAPTRSPAPDASPSR